MKLADKGVESVTWNEIQKDGSEVEKSGDRRVWEGSLLSREIDLPTYSDTDRDNDGPGVA
ncbi:hypothetical protein [Pectobacterium versatile]|uniref:hypothetical protein n=1 Tax=Pectobacterium versatile TaxID=2488639 RepID=UPI001F4654C3|nr:hypothetical protein [Pectobacterium versatile]